MVVETVRAVGHKNVTALHSSTFEITRDAEIALKADCIIAVRADRASATLTDEYKRAAACDDAVVTATITCGGYTEVVRGWGSSKMTFSDCNSMVFRVSDYVCDRTVMINADKPASRLDQRLIDALAAGNAVTIELKVEKGTRPQPSFDLLFEE